MNHTNSDASELLRRMQTAIDTTSIELQLARYRGTGTTIEAVHLHPDDIAELVARMRARGLQVDVFKPLSWNSIPIVKDEKAPRLPRRPVLG